MTEQKATPTFIAWKRMYVNEKYNNEIHVFDITVENQDKKPVQGIFTTTKKDQTKFKVGTEVTMKFSKTTEDHEQVWKIDKVTEKPSGGGGYSGGRKDPKKDKAILANVSLYCALEFLIHHNQSDAVKPDLAGIYTIADKIYAFLSSNSPDIQSSINVQACVKRVAEYVHMFPNVDVTTSTAALEMAAKLNVWVTEKMNG